MPPELATAVFYIGVGLVLVGLIGKVTVKEFEVGTSNPIARALVGFLGALFVMLALHQYLPEFSRRSLPQETQPSVEVQPVAPTPKPYLLALEGFLAAGDYRAAELETNKLVSLLSVNSYPCNEIRDIDSLWQSYSNSKFGFQAQINIWNSSGQNLNSFRGVA